MKKILLFCGATAFAIANLFYGNLNPTTSQDLTLENIDAVGTSAAEAVCDASNDEPCRVEAAGAAITGKGRGYIIW